jgi:hypothetical protein
LIEVKGKGKDKYKTWVNQEDYNIYYEFVSKDVKFLYFIYVDENEKIYRHKVTNPQDFKQDTDSDGKPIYYIPENLIHEAKITDEALKDLDVCMTVSSLEKSLIKKPKK